MALSIRNHEAEKLARAVAEETGETITQTIIHALEEKWLRLKGRKTVSNLTERVMNISDRCRKLPDEDTRTADEILGYNSEGGLDSW